jgi:hypothetical protein
MRVVSTAPKAGRGAALAGIGGVRFKERQVRPGVRRTALGLLDDQPAEPGQLHRADHDGHDQPRSSPAGNRDGRRDRPEAVEVRPRQPRAGARYMDD